MLISFVTETFPPEVNGVARTLRAWAQGLADQGHRVEVVRPTRRDAGPSSGPWQELRVPGAPLPRYPELRFGWPCYFRLRRRWRRQRPHLVHVATEGPLGWSALMAARHLGIPVSSSFHTNFHRYGRYYGYRLLRRFAVSYLRYFHNLTRRTFVPSPAAQQELEEAGFRNLELLGRGVDVEAFTPRHRDRKLRQQWGAADDDLVVISVGRLAAEKNLALTLQTFAAMREADPRARLVFIGDGPEAARLAREHPEHAYMGLCRGRSLAACYASADLLLFPSLTETFGNVVLEGMASGLAVLAYDYAAASMHIRHENNGYAIATGQSQRYVEAGKSLAARGAAALRPVGAAARTTALALTWPQIVGRFARSLRDVAGGSGNRHVHDPETGRGEGEERECGGVEGNGSRGRRGSTLAS